MNLIYIAALVAVCSAAKLDRTYLPPASSKTAGGSDDLLVPHFRDYFEPGRNGLPKGAAENEFDGVVVEAAAPGTRATGSGESGLGGSRISYGSTHSKVGEAAFRDKQQQRPDGNDSGSGGQLASQNKQHFPQGASYNSNRPLDSQPSPNFHQGALSSFKRPRPGADQLHSQVSDRFHQGALSEFNRPRPAAGHTYIQAPQNFHQGTPPNFNRFRPAAAAQSGPQSSHSFHKETPPNFIGQRPQSALERTSNTVRLENNVGSKAYNYAYETENGIRAEERGVSVDGVSAEGGFSYTGDDGKFYKITYTAGEGGYQPVGDHLPTPPPIPDEILKSLEQNAKEDVEGSDDNGSYDAAKYNAEDDNTKSDSSNSQQPAFGKRPESDVNVSGTFINQNNRPSESLSTNNQQEQTYTNRFSEQHSFDNNFTSTEKGLESNDDITMPNVEQQSYDTTKFIPSQNIQSEDDATITQFGLTNTENNFNKQSNEFGSNEFSRPINLGSTQFSEVSVNKFDNKQPNLQHSNYFTQNKVTGINSDTIQTELSPQQESQGISGGSDIGEKNINQPNVGSQGDSQILSHNIRYMNNIQIDRNPNVHESQSSIFPNIHSTLPSLELSTPFEYFSKSNQDMNVKYPNQKQRGSSSHLAPRPTQEQPFSAQGPFDSQKNVMANGEFITSNADASLQLPNSNSQQDSDYSQRLPSVKEHNFKIHSPNTFHQDQPYYYNPPSVIFNPYIRPTTPTFAPEQNENSFSSMVSSKYPSPPTVATIFSTMFPGRNMFNQNSNIPHSFITQNSRLSATSKYPQPPTLGHIILAPTSPTMQSDEKVFVQHTGITQASVSPFPSISPTEYNLNYNAQQTGTDDGGFSPNSQSNKIQEGINDKPESDNTQAYHVPNSNMVGGKTRPGQQYDGEVYEYKKPTTTLLTPTESEESIQQNGFSQFGQKLKPAPTQGNKNLNQNENTNNQKYPSSQVSQSLPGAVTESQNSEPQSSLQVTTEPNNGGFNKDKINGQPIRHEQPTSSSQFSPGAFNEAQTTADYNGPFGFSSRIRPCCQGFRRTSIGKTPDRLTGNDFQNSSPFGHQNTNLRPGFESGKVFSTQTSGLQKDSQNAQTTSQSLFSAKEEEFDGARKPPSFDEASGYHY